MKTHLIKDTGEVLIVPKPEHLKEMQTLVQGPIEIVNASMPKASALLKDSIDLKEMICNEEGLFNSNFKTNENDELFVMNPPILKMKPQDDE